MKIPKVFDLRQDDCSPGFETSLGRVVRSSNQVSGGMVPTCGISGWMGFGAIPESAGLKNGTAGRFRRPSSALFLYEFMIFIANGLMCTISVRYG